MQYRTDHNPALDYLSTSFDISRKFEKRFSNHYLGAGYKYTERASLSSSFDDYAGNSRGKFRIEGLGVGKLKVYAESQGSKKKTEFAVIAGQALQWNPVIQKGLVLRGRVVDEQDRPAAKVQIMASLQNPGKDDWHQHVQTDKEGRFALNDCVPGKKIRIRLYSYPRRYVKKTIVVKPDAQGLVIRMQSLGKPSVYISGQVLGPDGKPVKHCRIRPYSREHYAAPKLITDAGDGRFKLGPNPPGEYRVTIEARGYARLITDFKKLAKNETWDVGVIRLKRPGFLQVTLKGETSLLPERFFLPLQKASGERVDSVRGGNGKVERSNPLAPGTYYLQVTGKNCAGGRHKFEIQSGQDTQLDIPLSKGIPVVLEFEIQIDGKAVPVPLGGAVAARSRLAAQSGGRFGDFAGPLTFGRRAGRAVARRVGATVGDEQDARIVLSPMAVGVARRLDAGNRQSYAMGTCTRRRA